MDLLRSLVESLTNDSIENKLELLRMVLPLNATILLAVISLAFVVFQLDRYKDYKQFNYRYLGYCAVAGLLTGVVMPLMLLQKTGMGYSSLEASIYIICVLSPLLVSGISALYLWQHMVAINTKRIVNDFQYIEPKDNSAERASRQHPLAAQVEAICKWHGLVMQERDSADLSGLVKRDDLLIRITSRAILENDTATFKMIVQHYARLLLTNKSYVVAKDYEDDLNEIAEQLIYAKKDKLYDYMIDELSISWLSGSDSLENLSDTLGKIYASLVYKYIDIGEDLTIMQKAMGLLVNFHFLVVTSETTSREWLNTRHSLEAYLKNTVVKLAQKDQPFNLWLMHEKVRYLANHGGEVKKASLMSEYMTFMYITGIAGRVYGLHCGASNCSKSLYQHAIEDLEELSGWRTKLSNKQQEIFDRNYREVLSKLIGYEVTLDYESGKYEADKDKPKIAHSVTLGPSRSTSDSKKINYSDLTIKQFERCIFSYGRLF